jgi:hypothetical protein
MRKLAAVLLTATVLATPALAQTRQPASLTITPTTMPEVLHVLDNTGAWVPTAGVLPANHAFLGLGNEVYVRQFQPHNDWVGDDGPAIAAAISAAQAAGGGAVYLDQKPYWNQTQALLVPKNVRLSCIGWFNKFPASGYDFTNYPCTIYQKAGASLENQGAIVSVGVLQDQAHFQPQTGASRAAQEAFIAGFNGVGISYTYAGSASLTENVLVGGFATCLGVNGGNQVQLRSILGDCAAGLDVANSHDDNFLFSLEMWPFLTTNQAHTFDAWTISGLADNGSGAWRVTTSTVNDIVTGEKIWVYTGEAHYAAGAGGQWTVTRIDATHFDLQGSVTAPTTTGNTIAGSTYIPVASTANLAVGMGVSGSGIPTGVQIGAVWRTRNAISLAQNLPATATATGVALTFVSGAYPGSGGEAFYDGTWRAGAGFALGDADGMMCSQCFAFGNAIGYNFRSAIGVSILNAQYDQWATYPHVANQNLTPIGVEFTSGGSGAGAYGNVWKGSLITNAGVFILNNMTTFGANATVGNTVEVERLGSASGDPTLVEQAAGGLIVKNIQNATGGEILIDNAAAPPFFVNNRLPGALVFSTGATPQMYSGQSLFGGNLDQQGPSQIIAQHFLAASNSPGGVGIDLYNATRPTDEKYWRWFNLGNLCLQAPNDAYSTANNALCINRTGATPTGVLAYAPTVIAPAAPTHQALLVQNTDGGGYGGELTLVNSSAGTTAGSKYLRVNPTGALEVLNAAASGVAMSVDDVGNVSALGHFASQGLVGFSGAKTAGSCVLTITGGIITNVTGC